MQIKDFMITDVVSVSQDSSVKDLLKTLVTNKIGGVPVIDEKNNLLGMVSDGDIIRHMDPQDTKVVNMFSMILVREKEDLQNKLKQVAHDPVKNFMRTKHIYTVSPEDKLGAAISIFSKHNFKKLPVVDEGNQVIGVISRGDVIRHISTVLIND